MMRALKWTGLVLLAAFVGIQFIPDPRTNPPVTREVRWDAPATRELVRRACFDCHTNETTWPWYSHIAPASMLVIGHVNDGRRRMNSSERDKPQRATFKDVEENVSSGEMPIWNYVIAHPQAKLTPAEKTQLIDGLRATFLQDPPIRRTR